MNVFFIIALVCAVLLGGIFLSIELSLRSDLRDKEKRLKEKGEPIYVDLQVGHFDLLNNIWHLGMPDSAGGWDIKGTIKNLSDSAIWKVTLHCCGVGAASAPTLYLEYTDLLLPNKKAKVEIRHKWYGFQITGVFVRKVEIEFANGQKQTVY